MRRHRRVRLGRGSVHRHRQDVCQHDRELQVRVPARVQEIREVEFGFWLSGDYHDLVIRFSILTKQKVRFESPLEANPNVCEDVNECGDNGICGIDSECQVCLHNSCYGSKVRTMYDPESTSSILHSEQRRVLQMRLQGGVSYREWAVRRH